MTHSHKTKTAMPTKRIIVDSIELPFATFAPENHSRPLRSLPLRLVESPHEVHNGFTLTHEVCRGDLPFTAEVLQVEDFLSLEPQQAIDFEGLVTALCATHSKPTRDQAFSLCRACASQLPSGLVLFPLTEPITVPGYEEPMFLARGTECGRKGWAPGGCYRKVAPHMVLVSPLCVFTGDTYIVGIPKT